MPRFDSTSEWDLTDVLYGGWLIMPLAIRRLIIGGMVSEKNTRTDSQGHKLGLPPYPGLIRETSTLSWRPRKGKKA